LKYEAISSTASSTATCKIQPLTILLYTNAKTAANRMKLYKPPQKILYDVMRYSLLTNTTITPETSTTRTNSASCCCVFKMIFCLSAHITIVSCQCVITTMKYSFNMRWMEPLLFTHRCHGQNCQSTA